MARSGFLDFLDLGVHYIIVRRLGLGLGICMARRAVTRLRRGIRARSGRLRVQQRTRRPARQAPQQARLLGELATGLATLHAAIADRDDVVVIVQSEFGRRARENGSGGTDHGAANVAFVFGGGVAGGLIGAAPSLDDLDGQGDLRVGIDQRTLLAALAQRCFELDTAAATSCFKAAPLSL